jgi:hypothetical protein
MARVRISRKNVDARTRALLTEVQRKASIANKRLERLERNNLTDLPAYRSWVDYGGGVRFSVAGKDYNELQAELARVNHFLNSKTSLVREANKYLKDIARMTGVKYEKVSELPDKLSNFFKLASQVEQYLRLTEQSASAIGYQKIWEVINKYVEEERQDLEKVFEAGEDLIPRISNAISSSLSAEMVEDMKQWKLWDEI